MNFRELRISRGLTQDELASRQMIVDIEAGRRLPGQRLVVKLARKLGVGTTEVFRACVESRDAAVGAA